MINRQFSSEFAFIFSYFVINYSLKVMHEKVICLFAEIKI